MVEGSRLSCTEDPAKTLRTIRASDAEGTLKHRIKIAHTR
jgi:hypothetical protein